MPPADLYNSDFYLWTQAQAEALRAAGKGKRGSNTVEWEQVAEEVEDMGNNHRNKCMSWTLRIIQHLYCLEWTQRAEPVGGWRAEILTFRADLNIWLTGSIRRDVEGALEKLHRNAALVATEKFGSEEPGISLDTTRRWSLAQILGEENDPLA